MSTREDELLLVYRKGRELLEGQLRQTSSQERSANVFTGTLRVLWPDAALCYCRLGAGENAASALVDGEERAEAVAALEAPIRRWLATPERDAAETLAAPAALGLTAPLRIARVRGPDRCFGAAAVVLRDGSTPEEHFWVSALLDELCNYLGLQLRTRELLAESAQQSAVCALADMVGPVSHEMQNIFNNIVLQAALVSRDVPAAVRPDIDMMRRLGLEASAMMGKLDSYRYRLNVLCRPVELNLLVASFLAALPAHSVPVRQELAPALPPALANESDLRRLLGLLVANARAVVETEGGTAVTVRTAASAGKVLLLVEDDGPAPGDDPGQVFEPFAPARPGANSLELAACHGLARKLQGTIGAAAGTSGGLTVTVELDAAGLSP